MKKSRLVLAALSASIMMSGTAFAGTWQPQESGQWKYQNDDGSFATGWIEDSGKSYYLDENGIMLFNTTTPDEKQVGADGALVAAPLFDYDLPDCHITYLRHELSTDYNGEPCLIIYYNYTNKKSEECSAMGNSAYLKSYQNGIQCDRATISYSAENKAIENHYRSVLTGTTIEVAEAFKITDTSDITLILTDLFDWTGNSPKLTVTLSIK